jgi:predicted histone-like DNA-binding protein
MVYYVLARRINFKDLTGPKLFYAHAKSVGETTTRELAIHISKRTGISVAQVMAFLEAFIDIVPERLADGEIVRLGEFGNFSLALSSEGAETKEEFVSSMIRGAKMKFHPGKLVQNVIKTMQFQKQD